MSKGERRTTKTAAQRTMEVLRKEGYKVAVVEKWNAFAKVRQDLFGFIDLVAIREGTPGVLGVQCTTQHNLGEHIKKAAASPLLKIWLKGGNKFLLYGWYKPPFVEKWQYDYVDLFLNQEDNYSYNHYASGEAKQYDLPISLEPLPKTELGSSGGSSNS